MYLCSPGLVVPVGLSANAATAAVRAGVSGVTELPFRLAQNQRVLGAFVEKFALQNCPARRLFPMLTMAVEETLRDSGLQHLDTVPLLVCLPEADRPGAWSPTVIQLLQFLSRELDVAFHPRLSQAIPAGRTSAFMALSTARKIFNESSGVSACVICGMDSMVTPETILWLHELGLLKTDDNSDGAIPGEAAAAIVVRTVPRHDVAWLARVSGLGFGHENTSSDSNEPLLGLGLTAAARSALAEAGKDMADVHFRMSDVSGLTFEFKEQALMIGRMLRVHRDAGIPLIHAADSIGDTGAVAGLIQVILVMQAFRGNYAAGETAACFTTASSGARAVAILTK
jgi:3-oxoacyl-[acyl-carrier-protein] synthase I